MSALYEHIGYQRFPRRRLRGAGQGRIAGGGDRGGASQPAQALRRVPGARRPRGARERRRRARATSITSRSRAIPRRTCTRRSCSRSRSGRRSRSSSRTGSRTSPRCAGIEAELADGAGRGAARAARQVPRRRAPQVAHLERVLHLAVRGGGLPVDRRVRRLRVDDAGAWGAIASSRSSIGSNFPHSAGLFYTAVTQFLGFPPVRRGVEDDGARPLRQARNTSTSCAR